MADGYRLITILDVATTLRDWTADVMEEWKDKIVPEQEEGQTKDERDWSE